MLAKKCPVCNGTQKKYVQTVDDEDKYENCMYCDGGNIEVLKIINFSHPLTKRDIDFVKQKAEEFNKERRAKLDPGDYLTVVEIQEVIVKCQFNLEDDMYDQVKLLADQVDWSAWCIVVPPALGVAAYLMGSVLSSFDYLKDETKPCGYLWSTRDQNLFRVSNIVF